MEFEDEAGRDWSICRFRGFLERGIPLSEDRHFQNLPLPPFSIGFCECTCISLSSEGCIAKEDTLTLQRMA